MAGLSVTTQRSKQNMKMEVGARKIRANGTPNMDWSETLYQSKVNELIDIVSRYDLLEKEKALFKQYAPALRASHYNYITAGTHETFVTLMLRAFARIGKDHIVEKITPIGSIFSADHGSIIATADGYSFSAWLKPGVEEAKGKKDKLKFSMKDAYILGLLALSDDATKPPENKIRLEGSAEERHMLEIAISRLNNFLPKKERRVMTNTTGFVNAWAEFKVDMFSRDKEIFEDLFGFPPTQIKRDWNPFSSFTNTVPALAMGFAPAQDAKAEESAVKTADDAVAQAVKASQATFATPTVIEGPANAATIAVNNMIAELENPPAVHEEAQSRDLGPESTPHPHEHHLNEDLSELSPEAIRELMKGEAYPEEIIIGRVGEISDEQIVASEVEIELHPHEDILLEDLSELSSEDIAELMNDGQYPEELIIGRVGVPSDIENTNASDGNVLREIAEIDVTEIVAEVGITLSQDDRVVTADNQGIMQTTSGFNDEAASIPESDLPASAGEISDNDQKQQIEQGLFAVHSAPLYAEEIYKTVRNLVCSMPDDYAGRTIDRLEKVIDSMPQFPGRENLKDSKRLATAIAIKLEKQGLVRLSTNPNGDITIGHVTTFMDRGAEFNAIAKNMLKRPEDWIGQSVGRIAGGLEILAAGKGLPPANRDMAFFTAQGMLDFMVFDGIVKLDAQSRIASIATNLLDVPSVRKDFSNARAAAVHYKQPPQMPVEQDRVANDYAEPSLVA